jgi:two-component system chemotaxis response regulator CheB
VVAIAASTGGPAAVASVLGGLRGLQAPLLVVQHIHASFAAGFATWLERATGVTVAVVEDSARLAPGRAYVVAGQRHLRLAPGGIAVADPEPQTLHRPSADILFESVAAHAGPNGVGVVLTGMGNDGAAGLAALRSAGGTVIAQDEASSVVFGMPQAAVRSGAAQHVAALEDIPLAVRQAVARRP